jgi:tetratricopeptide (TPR) repeat protein
LLLLPLAILTWRQCGMYHDLKTLWSATLERNPDCPMAHANLGSLLLREGKVDDAIAHFQQALAVQPDDGLANCDMGEALAEKGRLADALAFYQRSLNSQPDDPVTLNDLGTLYAQQGRLNDAIAAFNRGVHADPDNAVLHFNLGNALFQARQVDAALTQYQQAVALKPGLNLARSFIGLTAWSLATNPEAAARDGNRAVQLAEQMNQLASGADPVVLGELAAAYAEAGRFSEAVSAAKQAIELASARFDAKLVESLRGQLECYQADRPFRDDRKTGPGGAVNRG